jgi:alpha-amylase
VLDIDTPSVSILQTDAMFIQLFSALLSITTVAQAASAAQWKTRSIYQILTDRYARTDGSTTATCESGYQGFCGGSWAGITQKLDYIQGMGFDAIWISPVVEQVADPKRAYHGYAAKNVYGLNAHFGTAEDLRALAKALHDRGMYLMVDVVPNHFAFDGTAETTDYSSFYPFNDRSYFHDVCFITDWTNVTQIQRCWLGGDVNPLPDMKTEAANVRSMWNQWITGLVSNYSLDGIRVDTAQNIEHEFFPEFNKAAGVFTLGEVASYYTQYQCDYQKYIDGVLGYAAYYTSHKFFNDTSATPYNLIYDLVNTTAICKDPSLIGEFSENHDKPRFASYTLDMSLAKNMIAYTMSKDGIPIIYQGQEQHYRGGEDPYNREPLWFSGYNTDAELYRFVKQMNAVRKLAIAKSTRYITAKTQVVYYDAHTVGMQKGPSNAMTLTLVNNVGASAANYTVTIRTSVFAARSTVVDVLSCTQSTVGAGGSLKATISQGKPMIFYLKNLLKGTGWCGQ